MKKNHPKADDILAYLPDEDKILFLGELLQAIEQSKSDGNFDAVNLCITSWEDTVELLSIPGLKDHAWDHYNELKESGAIN